MKPSREEWDNRLKELIRKGSYHYVEEVVEEEVVIEEPTFKQYRKAVDVLTNAIKHTIEGIEKRGWNTYHIDHKISVSYGFNNGIPPEHISHESNLRIVSKEENKLKGTGNLIDEGNSWIISGYYKKETV